MTVRYLSENESAWLRFARGEWQTERPTVIGEYPTKTKDGFRGQRISIYYNPVEKRLEATHAWSGSWWSLPYPDLPDCKK